MVVSHQIIHWRLIKIWYTYCEKKQLKIGKVYAL